MLCDLANIYREGGEIPRAKEYYTKAIKIMEWYEKNASKGVKTFDSIAMRNLREYAKLLRKENRIDEAKKMEAKADSFKPDTK